MKIISTRTFAFVAILLLFYPNPYARSQNNPPENDPVLFRYDGRMLRDSKWGKIPELQKELSEALVRCGRSGIKVDGLYGRGTQRALSLLITCPEFETFAHPPGHPLHGTVHKALWEKLLPNSRLPSVHERVFALTLTHEGTDYDRVEWNYETPDDKSALTWGPYGATVGWGNEVRAILKKVNAEDPGLLRALFPETHEIVRKLMERDPGDGYQIMKTVFADAPRKKRFEEDLRALGATEEGRKGYDWYAFGSGQWLKPNLRQLYRLIPRATAAATEVDYAFFLDLGMHATISNARITLTNQAIHASERERGRQLKPAERRRVIAKVFADEINQQWRQDRIGRNVVFYVDAIGEGKLTEEERSAWQRRTGRRASNFGLSDQREYFPDFFK